MRSLNTEVRKIELVGTSPWSKCSKGHLYILKIQVPLTGVRTATTTYGQRGIWWLQSLGGAEFFFSCTDQTLEIVHVEPRNVF